MTSPPLDLSKARKTKIHASGQALLYDVAKRVRSGYHWWITGEVDAGKILAVVAKLDHHYQTTADAVTRHRRKTAGDASSVLFVWPLRNDSAGYTQRFGFLLLATEHLDAEVMYDARKRPVRINLYANQNAIFHLIPTQLKVPRVVRTAGRKKATRGETGQPAETTQVRVTMEFAWQLSAKSFDLMRQRFAAAASNPAGLDGLRRAYSALPMVSGYRLQLKTVLYETKLLWKKATTPAVQAAKKATSEGTRPDPFNVSSLPYIRGFPKLYNDPPITLAAYLDANSQTKKHVQRRTLEQVRADHSAGEML
ncbi:hypothetical protein ACFFLM_23915 [Deinococcus oregonensis]|uniref:Uncharacterized protein n=1 Tax=Deinococcus oregonensis TaxID=1805970 RepID=A0ABV6B7R5_9DEIO